MDWKKLLVQNNGIYTSLVSKGVEFKRVNIEGIESDEGKLNLLTEENNALKKLAKENKPPPQPKKEKKEPSKKEKEEYEIIKEKKKEYTMITEMEEMKRMFFNNNFEDFKNELLKNDFGYYSAKYKYNEDKNGAPEFSAKNLLKMFSKNTDDIRKYVIGCFRCYKIGTNNEYEYISYWIVNTNDNIEDVFGITYEDFEFTKISPDLDEFIEILKKNINDDRKYVDDKILIDECYVH